MRLDRRELLAAGTFGLAALTTPGAAQLLAARGFTHNVASGEPGQDRVLLWTRYVAGGGDSARLRWEISPRSDFARVAASGEATAESERDWCVKPVAEGLEPGRWYFYRFIDAGGRASPIGRTRTLPDGPTQRFALGVFSCSNLPFGWFNAYAHAAARGDLDLILHLGDYLYEYERGRYPDLGTGLASRRIDPAGEIVTLADYRLRHASYRADADLQRLHQLFPMVAMWDDHESTNDSWTGGAQNHQPETEGDWQQRKAIAMRVYREWMPVSEENWTSYRIGDLAHIFRPETRLTGRSEPFNLAKVLAGSSNVPAALAAFRDGPWRDPSRTMLGAEQEQWLASGLRASTQAGVKWQVLAQQVIMGNLQLTPKSAGWVRPDATPEVKQRTAIGLAASQAGLPFNFDMWDGFPAARERLLGAALEANANLVVLSGDSHNAWAFDLDHQRQPAGVEFAGHSVTSPGYESYLSHVPPADIAGAIVERNPQLKWADTHRRGYLTVELTPAAATAEYLFLDTVRERSLQIADRHRMSVRHGTNRLA